MGEAEDWQDQIGKSLRSLDVTVLNPRRDDWDSSWKQEIENEQFRGQVEWELEGQEKADIIACYFDPKTKAPITLMELGLFGRTGKMIVACPEGYWRKGNVDIVCARYGIRQVPTLDLLIEEIRNRVAVSNILKN